MIVKENNADELISVAGIARVISCISYDGTTDVYICLSYLIARPIFNELIELLLHGEFDFTRTMNPYMSDDELEAGI